MYTYTAKKIKIVAIYEPSLDCNCKKQTGKVLVAQPEKFEYVLGFRGSQVVFYCFNKYECDKVLNQYQKLFLVEEIY